MQDSPGRQDQTQCYVRTIRELLIDNIDGKKLSIPPYQRKYTWDAKNQNQLCQDLMTARRSGCAEYHLGTLIFHDNDGNLDVVDGQQRLTTIAMMLKLDPENGPLQYDTRTWQIPKTLEAGIALWENEDTRKEILSMLPNCTVVCIVVRDISEAFQLFSTQNGRGKELTPVNLLKAYHFHEMQHSDKFSSFAMEPEQKVFRIESGWENSNSLLTSFDEQLLTEVISEHLFRLRKWGLGNFITETFSNRELSEFKGITLDKQQEQLPLLNTALLRRLFKTHYQKMGLSLEGLGNRLGSTHRDPPELDPFITATQPIINGEDFFTYAGTFVAEYQLLFPSYQLISGNREQLPYSPIAELQEFHDSYNVHCIGYAGCRQIGDCFARHVYESLCIMLFDRFGLNGLLQHYRTLYRYAYYERYLFFRLYYQTAGSCYAVQCCRAVLSSETLEELSRQFDILSAKISADLKDRKPRGSKCFSEDKDGEKRKELLQTGRSL